MEGQREVKVRNLWKEILTYCGTMRVWTPIQSLGNPSPLGTPDHQEPLKQKQGKNKLLLKCALSVRGTMMKGNVQNSYLEKKNRDPCLLNQ